MDVQEVVEVALQIVGVASMVAVITPTPKDNMILAVLKAGLNALAMNWGKAENKE